MDSFEVNKLIGAFLGTVFVIFTITLLSDSIFATHAPEKPGYAIAAAEPEAGAAAGGQESGEDRFVEILAGIGTGNPEAGANTFKKCQACHDATKGGPNKVGPNLWGVVDRPIASHEGFSYSGAMKEFSEGGSKHWTFENLAHFLHGPKAFVPGTAMAFAGVKDPKAESDLLAYLRTLSDSPAPLPEAAPAAPAAGGDAAAAPANGQAAPAEGQTAPANGQAAPANGQAAPAAGGTQQAEPSK
jgi:cytochrome c